MRTDKEKGETAIGRVRHALTDPELTPADKRSAVVDMILFALGVELFMVGWWILS